MLAAPSRRSFTTVIRVLIAKPGLDGHDRGAKVVARALANAGMEVVYTGLRRTPEEIVNAALEEDVHVIGLSILSGAHLNLTRKVMDLLAAERMTDGVAVIVGGTIPQRDRSKLLQMGVAAVHASGMRLEDVVASYAGLGARSLDPTDAAADQSSAGSGSSS
jgi:methylmalonyl-CoA mutase C-terminal domain/subunit